MSKPKKILVVCHGNLCRSPLASAVLVDMLGESFVRSRGLKAKVGSCVAKKVRDHVTFVSNPELLVYLQRHKAQQVAQEDVDWADLVVYMDGANYTKLCAYAKASAKAQCLGFYINEDKIRDPGFMSRGPELDAILNMVITAATRLGQALTDD